MENIGPWIEEQVADSVRSRQAKAGTRTTWRAPLVAYADARDPMFAQLKEIIAPTHLTPRELLPGAETVIAYFLPFHERIGRSNSGDGPAARAWAVAYIETNRLLMDINARLARALNVLGYEATQLPPTHNFDEEKLVSDWSHKHVAYIAGLGTFGLHHMLITGHGCSGRLNSLITNARIAPTPRETTEACLYKADGACRACVQRCPARALRDDGFDRRACYSVCLSNAAQYEDEGIADVCGKCVSVVPCSFVDPVRAAAHLAPEQRDRDCFPIAGNQDSSESYCIAMQPAHKHLKEGA